MALLRTLVEQQIRFAKFTGQRYRIKKPAALGYPSALEIQYRKQVRESAEFLTSLIEKHLMPAIPALLREAGTERVDAYTDTLDSIINTIRGEYGERYSEDQIRFLASEHANRVSNFHRNRLTRILSNSIGVDIFMTEPYLQTELRSFVQENVDLITSIPEDQFSAVRLMVKRGVRSGQTIKDTEKQILREWGDVLKDKPKNRAELIARDQNGKLFGQLNHLRQTELGIQKYIWRDVDDARVRPNHAAKDGKEFFWNKPPSDTGHPGQDYQCRCWAEPIILSALDETEAAGVPDPQPVKKTVRRATNIFANWQIDKGIKAGIDDGVKAINKVYKPKKVTLEPIPIKASYGKRTTGQLTLSGEFKKGESGLSKLHYKLKEIKVNRNAKAKDITFLHEFGHYYDYTLGNHFNGRFAPTIIRNDPRFANFWKAIDESDAIKNLKAYTPSRRFKNLDDYLEWKKNLPGTPLSDKYQRYLLSQKEVWARAFAQYMAVESKNPKIIAQIAIERKHIHQFAHWDDDDFEPIRKAIKEILDELG